MDKEFSNKFSENKRLDKLTHSIVTDVNTYAREQIKNIKILEFMKKNNHIDSDILDLFIKNMRFLEYAEKEMNPDQIDMG